MRTPIAIVVGVALGAIATTAIHKKLAPTRHDFSALDDLKEYSEVFMDGWDAALSDFINVDAAYKKMTAKTQEN